MTRSGFRLPAVSLATLATILTACGGENLVLPSEGTAASIGIVSGNNQNGTVGDALGDSLVVRVTDSKGRPVPDQPVSWSVAAGGGSVAPTSTTTDANGRTAASWTLGSGAGTQQVLAKPTGNGAPGSLQAAFAATAGASSASALVMVSGDAQTAVAGSALADSLVVKATDALGNPVAGVSVQWAAVGGGAVSMASVVTGPDGRSAVKRTLGPTAGAQTTTATVSGLSGSPLTFTATATVGSAGQLVIVQQPSATAASGTPFARQPKVQIEDGNGNPVSLSGVAVEAAIASGPAGASLSGTGTVATDGSGLATFGNLGISGPSGSYTLNFAVPNRTDISGTPPTTSVTIAAGTAMQLALVTSPSSTVKSGVAFPQQPVVELRDAAQNRVAVANVTIIATTQSCSGISLSGTTSILTGTDGRASFTNLVLTGQTGGCRLLFSSGTLTPVLTGTLDVTSGPVSSTASTVTPLTGTMTAGDAGIGITVTAKDQSGNVVSGAPVMATSAAGFSTSGTTGADGKFAFTYTSTSAGANTITITVSSVELAQHPVITVNPAGVSATQSTLVLDPASIVAGGAASTATVTALDAYGNPISAASVELFVSGTGNSIGTNPVSTNGSGVATFAITSTVAETKTVTATVNSALIDPSSMLTVTPGPASASSSTVTASASPIQAGSGISTITVTAIDQNGNVISGANVSLSASDDPSFAPSGSTDGSGVASFDYSSTIAGDHTITATVGGVALNDTPVVTVTPGPVSSSQSGVSASPASIPADGVTASTVTVTARDDFGNPVPNVPVLLSQPSPDATLAPTTGNTGGVGEFTTSLTSTVSGTYTVSATADGVAITQTADVTVQ